MIGCLVGGLIGGAVGGYIGGHDSVHTVHHTQHIHHQADPKAVAHAIIAEFVEMRQKRIKQLTDEAKEIEKRQKITCAYCGKEIRAVNVIVNKDELKAEYERGDRDSVFVTLGCGCHKEETEIFIRKWPASGFVPFHEQDKDAEFLRTDVFKDCVSSCWTLAEQLNERRCNIINNRDYGAWSSLGDVWDLLKRFYTQYDADEHDGKPHPTAEVMAKVGTDNTERLLLGMNETANASKKDDWQS